ncbi:MAG TPA: gamma-glutamyl-gamma-aminobutyrate hydrolase family protein, partial [Dermatophilaceae bacterium]|nr:gamma-glutamyl-gamma-aminobutyrate hydrolase family protein [Dermatophilaceae bacterium]
MADDSTAVAGVPGPLAGRHTRPRIAVPGRFSTNASALRSRALVGSRSLLDGVYAAGGDPLVVLPSAPGGEVTEAEVSDRLSWADGILLPGGGDLAAHWSGQPDHEALYDVDVEQDAFDLTIARWALRIG